MVCLPMSSVLCRMRLNRDDMQLITIGLLLESKADRIALNMRYAHKLCISFSEIKGVILQSTYYLGMPKSLWAMRKLRSVMDETEATFDSPMPPAVS
jgi:hypothetical protein